MVSIIIMLMFSYRARQQNSPMSYEVHVLFISCRVQRNIYQYKWWAITLYTL